MSIASPQSERTATFLCVDLDGTLIATDMLWECLLLLIKQSPSSLFLLPVWLLRGRAFLKRRIAERVTIRPETLPYRAEVLAYLRAQHAAGRKLVLATASDELVAQPIAAHLGLFDRVLASDGSTNLKGAVKAARLVAEFGEKQFAYAGDSGSDAAVWQHAASAIVVGSTSAAGATIIEQRFDTPPFSILTLVGALRPHHWTKNVLLVLPLLLAHRITPATTLRVAIGIVLFSLAASSIYVLNDLLDLQSDRAHPWKRRRPFAAGSLSIPSGLAVFALLLAGSLAAVWKLLGTQAMLFTLAYCALSLAYSFALKRVVLLDVFVLTSFYTLRLLIGATVASVPLSPWFLAFSSFFFFSLALAKRYSELLHAEDLVREGNSGRGYGRQDRELLSLMGVSSAFSATIILALYTQSSAVTALYRSPALLLLVCPLVLYWTSRVWLKAHRGELNEDPVTHAMRDPVSYLVGAAAFCFVVLAYLHK